MQLTCFYPYFQFDTAIIIVLIPLFDRLLFPFLKSFKIEFTMLQKIGAGFVLSILSMVAAGLLEVARLQAIQVFGTLKALVIARMNQRYPIS